MKWKLSAIVMIAALFCGLSLSAEFYVIPKSLAWDSALSYCRAHYSDLASVANKTQLNQLHRAAVENTVGIRTGVLWIGLMDDLSSWSWSASDEGSNPYLEYKNWMLGQPDNMFGLQMCAQMGEDGFWSDEDCLLNKSFVCFNDKSFVYVEEKLSWAGARAYCRERSSDLAWIQDSNHNNIVKSITEQYQNQEVWIGLHRRRVWSDGTEANFEHWKTGQPDNQRGAQHCTTMDPNDSALWWDEDCSLELPFICSGPPENVVSLDVELSSSKPLTKNELSDLVSTEFQQVLIKLGLSEAFALALRSVTVNETTESSSNKNEAADGEGA